MCGRRRRSSSSACRDPGRTVRHAGSRRPPPRRWSGTCRPAAVVAASCAAQLRPGRVRRWDLDPIRAGGRSGAGRSRGARSRRRTVAVLTGRRGLTALAVGVRPGLSLVVGRSVTPAPRCRARRPRTARSRRQRAGDVFHPRPSRGRRSTAPATITSAASAPTHTRSTKPGSCACHGSAPNGQAVRAAHGPDRDEREVGDHREPQHRRLRAQEEPDGERELDPSRDREADALDRGRLPVRRDHREMDRSRDPRQHGEQDTGRGARVHRPFLRADQDVGHRSPQTRSRAGTPALALAVSRATGEHDVDATAGPSKTANGASDRGGLTDRRSRGCTRGGPRRGPAPGPCRRTPPARAR